MKWSIYLGRIAGIPIYLHTTFALLLAWIGFMHWTAGGTLGAVVSGIVFTLALFGCVLLHELGHALAARRYGIPTRDITLLPIGGLARLERMPSRPVQELWVALAGPAVNVVIAAALLVWLLATRSLVPMDALGVASGSFAERLMLVNLFLVVFNLVPAFPMDGGRVLRALLALRLDYARATRIAARIGQGLAVAFGFIGLFSNPFLVLIAVFVWIGASQESAAVQAKTALGGAHVQAAMITDYRILDPRESVGRAVEIALAGSQRDFPVVERGRLVGILSHERLLETLSNHGIATSVGRVFEEVGESFDPRERLDEAFERMQASGLRIAPVLANGTVVGMLTLENVLEFLSFRDALDRKGGSGKFDRRPFRPVMESR